MNFIFFHCISMRVSDDDVWTDISKWDIPLPPTAAKPRWGDNHIVLYHTLTTLR